MIRSDSKKILNDSDIDQKIPSLILNNSTPQEDNQTENLDEDEQK